MQFDPSSALVAVGLFRLIFGNWNNFWTAVEHWFKLYWLSWIVGRSVDDVIAEFALFLYFGAMGALLYGEARMLTNLG